MPKAVITYVCSECGVTQVRWHGRCPECGAWGALVEEAPAPVTAGVAPAAVPALTSSAAVPLSDLPPGTEPRRASGVGEFDRVLGGGAVPGSVILLAGDPGIGKSTLLLQVGYALACAGHRALYVSGEESLLQVRMRAERLRTMHEEMLVLAETELETIIQHLHLLQPAFAVVDSIQTTYDGRIESVPGAVSQVRNSAMRLIRTAKETDTTILLIGHVTKEGQIAGPRVLEHMVDVVLELEGDRDFSYRILRAIKNRFGPVDEIGIFEMTEKGLDGVPDAGRALAGSEREAPCAGRAFTMVFEGSRPLLLEVQALAARSYYPYPRRAATGMELNRVQMLIAALEKRAGLRLDDQDVFASVQGGIKVKDPVIDLAFCAALISSALDIPLRPDEAFLGEVGILAQTYPAPLLGRRLTEAARLGFKRAYVPPFKGEKPKVPQLEIISVPDASALSAALEKAPAVSKGEKK
ncbi:MAG: hypothetical protein BWY76_02750 [bacterium ADurb.Bin429]|nr:MAG: hypothetical protein BWY76_02750 [bacterium ADurb.Bin429]